MRVEPAFRRAGSHLEVTCVERPRRYTARGCNADATAGTPLRPHLMHLTHPYAPVRRRSPGGPPEEATVADTPPTTPHSTLSSTLGRTRRSLHGVAELVLAGPQHRRSGTIRLRSLPGGFGTVAEPELRVEGTRLVAGDTILELDGATPAGLAAALGLEAAPPEGVYSDTSGVEPGETLQVDADDALLLARWWAAGDEALRALAPDQEPVIWPEHFDAGIGLDEVNYGVSPGDGSSAEPYAYVGPWTPREGGFWNAPFGAVRTLSQVPTAADVLEFFREGARQAGRAG